MRQENFANPPIFAIIVKCSCTRKFPVLQYMIMNRLIPRDSALTKITQPVLSRHYSSRDEPWGKQEIINWGISAAVSLYKVEFLLKHISLVYKATGKNHAQRLITTWCPLNMLFKNLLDNIDDFDYSPLVVKYFHSYVLYQGKNHMYISKWKKELSILSKA